MSAFSPSVLQALGGMLLTSPDSSQPSAALSQAVSQATPGTPLAQAAQLVGSNTPVVNPTSMASGMAQLDGPTAAATALGQASQNTANVQAGARELQGLARKQGQQETTATGLRVDAERQQMNELAPLHQEYAARLQSMGEEFAGKQADIRAKADQAFTTYLQSSKDYANMHTHDWWGSAPTGAQVLGVISQALAGGVNGLNGNLGSETPLDRVIRMDIERQKFEIQKTGDVADKAYNQYHLLTQQFGSEVLAEQALYTAAYESTKQRIDAQLKASGSGPNTAAYKFGQALIADANAKQAQYMANAKQATLQMTSHAVLADSNLKLGYAQLWQSSVNQAAAAGASAKPEVGINGVKGSEALNDKQKESLELNVKETRNLILKADDAKNILQQISDGKLSFAKAQPMLESALAAITLDSHRQEGIKQLGAAGQELVGAITGGESGRMDWIDAMTPGRDGTQRGRSPAQRAKLMEAFINELRRGLTNHARTFVVNGKPLQYTGKLDAASIRAEENTDASLPTEAP